MDLQLRGKRALVTGSTAGIARALSRGGAIPSGQTVLMVLDQFERWLDGNSGKKGSELVKALKRGELPLCVLIE